MHWVTQPWRERVWRTEWRLRKKTKYRREISGRAAAESQRARGRSREAKVTAGRDRTGSGNHREVTCRVDLSEYEGELVPSFMSRRREWDKKERSAVGSGVKNVLSDVQHQDKSWEVTVGSRTTSVMCFLVSVVHQDVVKHNSKNKRRSSPKWTFSLTHTSYSKNNREDFNKAISRS